jgi:hypothetical protein
MTGNGEVAASGAPNTAPMGRAIGPGGPDHHGPAGPNAVNRTGKASKASRCLSVT